MTHEPFHRGRTDFPSPVYYPPDIVVLCPLCRTDAHRPICSLRWHTPMRVLYAMARYLTFIVIIMDDPGQKCIICPNIIIKAVTTVHFIQSACHAASLYLYALLNPCCLPYIIPANLPIPIIFKFTHPFHHTMRRCLHKLYTR